MKRRILAVVVSLALTCSFALAQPAAAEAKGCRDFGQNIALLATSYGRGFGQMAASTAPLNDTVEHEQATFCGS